MSTCEVVMPMPAPAPAQPLFPSMPPTEASYVAISRHSTVDPILVPVSSGAAGDVPAGTVYSLSTPDPQSCPATAFFLDCLPDPLGGAHSSIVHAHKRLNHTDIGPHNLPAHVQVSVAPGTGTVTGTPAGVVISLEWLEGLASGVERGEMSRDQAVAEIKGSLLEGTVSHVVQQNGFNTAPSWLTGSVAAAVRIAAHLAPTRGWKRPGQGSRLRGYEAGGSAGGQLLMWISGESPEVCSPAPAPDTPGTMGDSDSDSDADCERRAAETDTTPAPLDDDQKPYCLFPKPRHGPWPEFFKQLNCLLMDSEYCPTCWERLTGRTLDELWDEYFKYYGLAL